MRRTFVLAIVLVGMGAGLSASDWPQWRGANRLAIWSETGIVENLPDELQVTWRVPINSGYAGPAVSRGRGFVTDWQEDPDSRTIDGTERVLALDENTNFASVLFNGAEPMCGENQNPDSYKVLKTIVRSKNTK